MKALLSSGVTRLLLFMHYVLILLWGLGKAHCCAILRVSLLWSSQHLFKKFSHIPFHSGSPFWIPGKLFLGLWDPCWRTAVSVGGLQPFISMELHFWKRWSGFTSLPSFLHFLFLCAGCGNDLSRGCRREKGNCALQRVVGYETLKLPTETRSP